MINSALIFVLMCFRLNSLEVFAQALQAFLSAASWDALLGSGGSDGSVLLVEIRDTPKITDGGGTGIFLLS